MLSLMVDDPAVHLPNSSVWMPPARRFSIISTDLACITAYNSIPIHLENTNFPTVGPQALNLSTRGLVSVGDNVLIGGFIVTGPGPRAWCFVRWGHR